MVNITVKMYLDIFFSNEPDLRTLRTLLTDDFCFQGPLMQAQSVEDYIYQLEAVGWSGLIAETIRFVTHDQGVAVLCDLVTPGGKVPTSEWFWLQDQTILVFSY